MSAAAGTPRRILDVAGRLWPVVSLALLLVVLTALTGMMSEASQRVVTVGMVQLIVVVGLYVFVGNSGIVSFGHVGFMAIGAYVAAILTVPPIQKSFLLPGLPEFAAQAQWSTTLAILAAAGVSTLVALVSGVALMRLAGLAASIGTLAVLVIVYVVISHWEDVTGGQRTLVGIPTDITTAHALVWAIVALFVAFAFQESRLGRRLRASSEDESAAKSIGIGIINERIAAFAVGAAIAGCGGALYGHVIGAISPDAFYFQVTFLTLTMLVVGGMRSLAGAVLGSVAITTVAEVLRRIEDGGEVIFFSIGARPGLREAGLAAIMLAILILRPSGLTGGRELRWSFSRQLPLPGRSR